MPGPYRSTIAYKNTAVDDLARQRGAVYFMLESVVLRFFLAGHDAESALAEGEQLVLSGVGGGQGDPTEVLGQGLGGEGVVAMPPVRMIWSTLPCRTAAIAPASLAIW
mgnify:CR=1 FL=1